MSAVCRVGLSPTPPGVMPRSPSHRGQIHAQDENACLAALQPFLSQPCCLLVRRHGDPLTPEPQSLTPITTNRTLYSWLWIFRLISFHLPSQPFSIHRKCLAHEGHSVVINFFLMNHLSSLGVRIGDGERNGGPSVVCHLTLWSLFISLTLWPPCKQNSCLIHLSSCYGAYQSSLSTVAFLTVIERIHE